LLEKGWGLFLGKAEEQRLELEGKINLIKVKVRFFPTVIDFILEGELRPGSCVKAIASAIEFGRYVLLYPLKIGITLNVKLITIER
jgi:hypothetical protein